MKTTLGLSVAAAAVLLLAACGGEDPAPSADPGSDPTSTATASASGTATTSATSSAGASPSDAPSQTGDASVDCLVDGSPWRVSTTDLEGQFAGVMRGINVTRVRIAGGQTLTVDPSLRATFTDNSTTTINVDMGGGLAMVMVQKHRGHSTGTLRAAANKLTAHGWTGGIRGTTKVTINGKASEAPFSAPTGDFGERPMTYDCADGTMNLSVQGSPFVYLFNAS